MIELCKINRLRVVRDTPQGLYLEEISAVQKREDGKVKCEKASAAKFTGKREDVLLPRPEVPENVNLNDKLDVFIYLDSSDRYTATLKTPKIYLGGMALLKIAQLTDIGVFLDWGLEKNLLLPFKEIVTPFTYDPLNKDKTKTYKEDKEWLETGKELPVVLYIDKSGRPAATMRVYNYLSVGDKYMKDSAVEATVIQINPGLGVFVAVDDRYYGMINIKEITKEVNVGERIFGRISEIRDDGRYMISLTRKLHLQMDNDAQLILKKLQGEGGSLAIGDKSDPKEIMKLLGMSKKAFKRAVGHLYKEGRITPGDAEIKLKASS